MRARRCNPRRSADSSALRSSTATRSPSSRPRWRSVRASSTSAAATKGAERIRKLTGSRSEIVFEPLPQDDPKQRCPDISKARRLLGWEPKVNLEEGLRLTLESFKKQFAETKAS